eukprot:3013197-Amphidinium_carterae.1
MPRKVNQNSKHRNCYNCKSRCMQGHAILYGGCSGAVQSLNAGQITFGLTTKSAYGAVQQCMNAFGIVLLDVDDGATNIVHQPLPAVQCVGGETITSTLVGHRPQ